MGLGMGKARSEPEWRQPAHEATQALRCAPQVALAQVGSWAGGGRKAAGGGWLPEGGHSHSLRSSAHSKTPGARKCDKNRGLLQWLAMAFLDPGVFLAFFVCFLLPPLLRGDSPSTLALPQFLPFSESPDPYPAAQSSQPAAPGRFRRVHTRMLAEATPAIAAPPGKGQGEAGTAGPPSAAQLQLSSTEGSSLGTGEQSAYAAIAAAEAVQSQAPGREAHAESSHLNWEMLRALQSELDAEATGRQGGASLGASEGEQSQEKALQGLRVFVYDMPTRYTYRLVKRDTRCLSNMFAAEVYFHHFILRSPVRTLDPASADWFYTPLYLTCDLTRKGLPLPSRAPRMMRSAIRHIAHRFPFWNRTQGADHFFLTPHDFGACFHFQEKKAMARGILPLLQRATLVQTFGQRAHPCHKPGSIVIPPYASPQRMRRRATPSSEPRSIFVYFRGLFYDPENDPAGGYYARGARASLWENLKDNPVVDISARRPQAYPEDMRRAVFCLCPLGWAPWSPRLVEAVVLGCIPVFVADDIILPFADVIPWGDIAVFVREGDVPRLDVILSAIDPPTILAKLRRLASPQVKRALQFAFPARDGDAFHQVLAALTRKLPHPPSTFLAPGEKGLDWSAGNPEDLKPWRPRDPKFWR